MRERLPQLTDRLPLGTRGLSVSPFCLGLIADPETVLAAYEAGINFFFITADMHWPMYEPLRVGLRELLKRHPDARARIVIAATAYVTQPEFVQLPMHEALLSVPELDHLDVLVAGGSYGHELPRRQPTFEAMRERGHCGARAIGASFHDREAALAALEAQTLDITFVRYNPEHPKAKEEVFDRVKTREAGRRTLLFNFKSTIGWIDSAEKYAALGIGEEMWRPHATDYYRFALTEAAVDGVLCSLPGAAGVRELAEAMAQGPLDDEDRQYLIDLGEVTRGKARVRQ